MTTKTRWQKAYKGPFTKREAMEIVGDFKALMTAGVSVIEKVAVRKRKKAGQFDVYIKSI